MIRKAQGTPIQFDAPKYGAPDVLIIAGEHSGDEHAADLVRDMLHDRPELKVYALGGPKLRAAGATVLHDMMAKSVVGFWEVLRDLKHFKALMGATAQWVREYRPKLVCFVDYPGFNLRLVKKLFEEGLCTQAGGAVKLVYYISPQIWAWKAWRRFSMSRSLDALAVIFPFEVECYKDTRLPATFVGHPFVRPGHELPVRYDPDGSILLLPGSRRVPVRRIFPVMLEAFRSLWRKHPEMTATVIYPSQTIKAVLEKILLNYEDIKARVALVPNTQARSGRALLTSSGTMSLACTLAGIPGVIIYKTSWFTYVFAKIIIHIKHLGIGSILLGRTVYPEFIQSAASVSNISKELEACALDPKRRELAAADAAELRTMLGEGLIDIPSPAKWLLSMLDN